MEKQKNVISMEMVQGAKIVKNILEECKNDEDWKELLNETDEEREQKIKEYETEMEELEKKHKEIEKKNKNKTDKQIEQEMKDFFEKGKKWW